MFVRTLVENDTLYSCEKISLNELEGLGKRCKFPSGIRGGAPAENKFLCFIKLRESHWWQSFWIFWRACCHNTVAYRCRLSGVQWRRRSVAKRGGGAEPARPPSKSATEYFSITAALFCMFAQFAKQVYMGRYRCCGATEMYCEE